MQHLYMPDISETELKRRLKEIDGLIRSGKTAEDAFRSCGFLKTEMEIRKERETTAKILGGLIKAS